MKLYRLFIALATSLCIFAACEKEGATSLDSIQLDKTYLSITADGGDAVLTINAKEAWAFAKDIVVKDKDGNNVYTELPTWLTASTLSGEAGETKVTFHADAIDGGREQELHILVGELTQYLLVRQGSLAPVKATCKEVIAGADGKTFTVTGTVTDIENTTYGNWWLVDETGKIYIYGTLDKDGQEKKFASLGIENGDQITVQGPKTTYGEKIELVNVTVIELIKSLIKVDTESVTIDKEGGEFTVKAAYKGNGVFVNPSADWIVLNTMDYVAGVPTKIVPNPADTAIISFKVNPNVEAARTGEVKLVSGSSSAVVAVGQAGMDLTIAEIIAAAKGDIVTSKPAIVTAKTSAGFVIADDKNAVYVYDNAANDVKIGDEVVVKGSKTVYNGVPEIEKITGVTVNASGKTVTYPLAKNVTGYATEYTATEAEYITICGKLSVSGKYYNVALEGVNSSTKQGSITSPEAGVADFNGKDIIITGYFNGLSGGGKYLNVIATSITEYTPGAKGTVSNPYGALELAALLAGGTKIEECVYVSGKVSKLVNAFGTQFGNGTFWISDDGTYNETDPTKNFEAYQVYYLGAKWWAEGDSQVAVGDEVVLYGNVTYYAKYKTPETSSKKAYLYSLNGKVQ
ncbi:MAG: hypothetical protein J5764_01480 [Bacteroidales bacterium]|nr:hypothetical protein [Bacteroidales bacterium]